MIKITFPDGIIREYEKGVTGLQIAESISPALARSVVSCGVNGETVELNRPILCDSTIALYRFEDEEGKHTFWHTSAHLLAEALKELYPGIQFGFGPAVENGFFYDVVLKDGKSISSDDFPMIEAKMMEMVRKNEPVVRKEISKAEALEMFRKDGQTFKCEHIDLDLEDGSITTYTQGSFTDLCRGPHLMSTGSIKALKNISSSGCFIGCFSYWNIEEQSSGFRMKDYIVGENRNDPASVILEVNPSYVKDELIVPNEEGEGFYKLGKPKSDLVFTDSNSRRISTAHFGHDYILNFSVGGEFKLEIDYYVEGEDDLRQIFKKGFCCK